MAIWGQANVAIWGQANGIGLARIGPILARSALLWAGIAGWASETSASGAIPDPGESKPPIPVAFDGFPLRLVAAAPDGPKPTPLRPDARALSAAEAAALLDRLPPLASAGPASPFVLPADGPRPPDPAITLADPKAVVSTEQVAQAASSAGDQQRDVALQVSRYSPQGKVAQAESVRISFDRPMVVMGSHAAAPAESPPLRMTPAVAGDWHWLGSQTLEFRPAAGRLPMATRYRLEVPAGTRALDGSALAKALSWRFETPPPAIELGHPGGLPAHPDRLILLTFNQRIDPAKLLPRLSLRGKGRKFRLRLANAAELAADPAAAAMAKTAGADRWIALRPSRPLPLDTSFELRLAKGSRSAEGPLRTVSVLSREFKTYAAPRASMSCGAEDRPPCGPSESVRINFSNLLPYQWGDDLNSMVRIEPPIKGLRLRASGADIYLDGRKPGLQRYSVHLSHELMDIYGQRLGPQVLSFEVGTDLPSLHLPGGNLVTLPPGDSRYEFYSINLATVKLTLYRVGPEHWGEYAETILEVHGNEQPSDHLPGELIHQQVLVTGAAADAVDATSIDLQPFLNAAGKGQLILSLEPGQAVPEAPSSRSGPRRLIWIQATDIALRAASDGQQMQVWATRLSDAQPLQAVELSLADGGESTATDANGLARLPLPVLTKRGLLIGRVGGDLALLSEGRQWGGASTWQREPTRTALLWHVIDDRGLYRPGEQVQLKGWVRAVGGSAGMALAMPPAGEIRYRVTDSRDLPLAQGTARRTGLGGFDLSFSLPESLDLGMGWVSLEFDGGRLGEEAAGGHSFRIEDFRTPEFELALSTAPGPHFAGGRIMASALAAYYSGGGLPQASVEWRSEVEIARYTPPGRSEWIFGDRDLDWDRRQAEARSDEDRFEGETDAEGRHAIHIVLDQKTPPLPISVMMIASVLDLNHQRWSEHVQLLVHAADAYVGLRTDSTFVAPGQEFPLSVLVVDLDGQPLPNRRVEVEAGSVQWARTDSGDRLVERLTGVQRCELRSNAEGRAECQLRAGSEGVTQVTALTRDSEGRSNLSRTQLWVAAGQRSDDDEGWLQLINDRDLYQPGQTARILVQAPFERGHGVIDVFRHELLVEQSFVVENFQAVIELPLSEHWIPSVELEASVVQTDSNATPAVAMGATRLSISHARHELQLSVAPLEAVLAPGGRTEVDVQVRRSDGAPLGNSEVTLIVVDEAILALGDYQLRHPMASFYDHSGSYLTVHEQRDSVLRVEPDQVALTLYWASERLRDRVAEEAARPAGSGAPDDDDDDVEVLYAVQVTGSRIERGEPIEFSNPTPGVADTLPLRQDFNPVAAFLPDLRTGPDGRVRVALELPDNLTRYRLMAVAAHDVGDFGIGESALTTRLPLMLRPSAPRFLNVDDRFELPVLLQNQTDQALRVQVAARVSGLALAATGFEISVPPNDRVELGFPASAGAAGTAQYQLVARAGDLSDASSGRIPIRTPASSEHFASYGVLDGHGLVLPLQIPTDAWQHHGGLQLGLASSALQSLRDAYLYLQDYPFECSEQLASRLIVTATLGKLLGEFNPQAMPDSSAMEASIDRDMKLLLSRQDVSGGFGLWRQRENVLPYVSLHATHALIRLQQAGFAVPGSALDRAGSYLKRMDDRLPAESSLWTRRHVRAYALHLRALNSDRDVPAALALLAEIDVLSALTLEAAGWLLSALGTDPVAAAARQELLHHLHNQVSETAGSAQFDSPRHAESHLVLQSDRSADAVILAALIGSDPDSDLIPKLVRGLEQRRVRGHWGNTQENAFVLLAMQDYYERFEATSPDYLARAWLGADYLAEQAFRGRESAQRQIEIPMSVLAAQSQVDSVTLSKDGPGRLYYRVGMEYAPREPKLAALDRGFEVQREYRALDGPNDVRWRDDGVWEFRAGARIEVRLRLRSPARRYHIALVDPLPAGLEAINPILAVSQSADRSPAQSWFEHQNLRSERVEAFSSELPAGEYHYSYVARATTIGQFSVPPARAEEMYASETFGRSASDRVEVLSPADYR